MYKKDLFLLASLGVLLPFITYSIGNQSSGARSLSLGNANTNLYDLWSGNNNQAGLGRVLRFGVGISHENRFGLSELSLNTVNLAIPFQFGTFGVTIQQLGFTDYSENKFGLAYGMKLSPKIHLGGQAEYYLIHISEINTENKNALTIELGLQISMTDQLSFGVHVYNLTNSKISGGFQEKPSMTLNLGLKYDFSKKVFAVLDIEKIIDLPTNLKAGIEYHPVEAFYFRGGLNSHEFHFTGGIGVQIKGLTLDLGFSHQTYLGYVSQIALSYSIPK
jgi:hypothetical protein